MNMKAVAIGIMLAVILVGFAGLAEAEKKGEGEKHLYLYEKDPETWEIVDDGSWGKLKYSPVGSTFTFKFNGHELEEGTDYTLIYYPDPWPGDGLIVLGSDTAGQDGHVHIRGSIETGDLTDAKIWLILTEDFSEGMAKMVAWNPSGYLFENNLIDYTDSD